MALTTLRALLSAQARSRWNGMRREAGVAGPLATLAVLTLLAAVLGLPCAGMLWVGLQLGQDLAMATPSSHLMARSLGTWNHWMFLYTVCFAFLGNFRHQPAFSFTELSRLPITAMQLLLAEIPAALLEVFPMLGAAGIVCSHLGLAIRMPAWSPIILLLALQSLLAMLALLLLLAALRRLLARHQWWSWTLMVVVVAGAAWLSLENLRWILRGGAALIPFLPISQAYAGWGGLHLDPGLDELVSGIARMALAIASTCGLLALAAGAHQHEISRRRAATGSFRSRSTPLRFKHSAAGIGHLFQKQLLDSKMGRTTLVVPLILVLPIVLVLTLVTALLERDDLLVEQLSNIQRLGELPLFALFLFLLVIVNSQIWMNQFGWDQGGIRGLLLLPIAARDLLLGKLVGLARYTGLQALIGVFPVLWVHQPSAAEALTGLGAAGCGLIATGAAGHLLSARFPRAVHRDVGATLPLYLAWIPSLLIVLILSVLTSFGLLGKAMGPWGMPLTFLVLFLCSFGAYLYFLPTLGERVHQQRERLLQM